IKVNNYQFPPLYRVGRIIINYATADRDNERLVRQVRINIVAVDSSECDRRKGLLASFSFSSIFRGERTEGQSQLRFIEAVLRQIGSYVFHKFRDLFVLQSINQTSGLARIC